MDKAEWKQVITESCRKAGTYQPFFDSVIETLAGIMELRDGAEEQYYESGGETVIEHTNQGGNTNTVKNPALVVLLDCNSQALAYWKELGLTAKSYKSMLGGAIKPEESLSLESLMDEIGI